MAAAIPTHENPYMIATDSLSGLYRKHRKAWMNNEVVRGARSNHNNMHPFHGNTKIWYQLAVKRLFEVRYLSQVLVRGVQKSALTRAFQ